MSVSIPTKLAGVFLAVSVAGCAAPRPRYAGDYYPWSSRYTGSNTPSAMRDDLGTSVAAGTAGWGLARVLGASGGKAAGAAALVGAGYYPWRSVGDDCAALENRTNGSVHRSESCRYASERLPDVMSFSLDGKKVLGQVEKRVVFKEEGGKPQTAYMVVANGQHYLLPQNGGVISVDPQVSPRSQAFTP